MPELPEVETMVRGIRDSMVNCKIESFELCRCDRKPMAMKPDYKEFSRRIVGTVVQSVRRLAKRIVICLSSGEYIVFEPRMTGLALVADPPSVEHLRFRFHLASETDSSPDTRSVWIWDRRGLGTLRLLTSDQFQEQLGPKVLGPDALDVSIDELTSILRTTKREVKVALLDQKLIAGIGNLYASEILHEAKVHPQTTCSRISKQKFRQIHMAMHRILNEAILYEGSTLNDGTYRNALNKDGSYQNKHKVYAKAGDLCSSCEKSTIVRIVQAQRSSFFCPRCQRTPRT